MDKQGSASMWVGYKWQNMCVLVYRFGARYRNDTMGSALEELRQYLHSLDPGSVQDTATCEALLCNAWMGIKGDYGGLSAHKIRGRLEKIEWCPPLLSFTIERHGATKCGSSRAELQDWVLDVESGTASYSSTRYRQLYRRSPPLKTKPLAQQIAALIVERESSKLLRWSDDGNCVRLVIGEIIPDEGAKETTASRRKRFRRDLTALLIQHGWEEVRPNKYCLKGIS